MTKIICDICGREEDNFVKVRGSAFSISLIIDNKMECCEIPIDICTECYSKSELLKNVETRLDFKSKRFESLFKEKIIKMIKGE